MTQVARDLDLRVERAAEFGGMQAATEVFRRWIAPDTGARFQTSAFPAWPAVVPPFLKNALVALPDGRAIKRATFEADRKNQYDIVDRRGALSGVLRLPRNERLTGSGKQSVYVVATEVDEVQYVRRHSWP